MDDAKKKIIPVYIVLFIYLIINNLIMFTSLSDIYIKLINPLFLLLISVITYYLTEGFNIRVRNKYLKSEKAFILVFFYFVLYFFFGLMVGFVDNISFDFKSIVNNFVSFFIVIIFKEYIRSRMIFSSKKNYSLFFITILFILSDIDFRYLFDSLSTDFVLFDYLVKDIISIILLNVISTYLICETDIKVNYVFRGVFSGILLFSPFLINNNWFIINLSLMLLLVILVIVFDFMNDFNDRKKRRKYKDGSIGTWCLFIFVFVFLLFIFGFFKYQPIAILSNSMKGYFSKGDAVIIEKINNDDLSLINEGDVIYYKYEDKYITHRVVEIEKRNNSYVFKTKGDNNNTVDSWKVNGEDVVGVVKFYVKYIGWPSVLLNELFI